MRCLSILPLFYTTTLIACVIFADELRSVIRDDGIEVTHTTRDLSQYFRRSGQCGNKRTVVLYNGKKPDLKELADFSPPMSKVDTSEVEYLPMDRANCLKDSSGIPGNLIVYDNGGLSDLSVLSGIYQIGGDLILFGPWHKSDSLKSLRGLENLAVVGGSLNIVGMDKLQDLSELESLKQINEDLLLWNNAALRSLNGLQKLQMVGKALYIDNNRSMKNLAGLENLVEIGYDLFLKGNGQLSDLSHLENVQKVWGNVVIQSMNALKTTKDLKNIQQIGIGIDIYNNPILEDLSGFSSLSEVNGDLVICKNKKLKSTKGFEGVKRVHLNLIVSQNDAVEDFSGFEGIKEVGGLVSISDNSALKNLQGLGALDEIHEDLIVNRNPQLEMFGDLEVAMIGTNLGGNIIIEKNKSLSTLGTFPAKLKEVNGGVRVDQNDQLKNSEIKVISSKAVEN